MQIGDKEKTKKLWKRCTGILLSGCMVLSGAALSPALSGHAQEEENVVTWVMSTEGSYWQEQEPLETTAWDEEDHESLYIDIDETVTYQEMAEEVWGGCFNERGWQKLMMLSEEDRNQVLDLLFDPEEENGLHLTLARMPIGSSDYAIDMYSLDDVEDDYDLSEFSIERDKQYLIPYIKAALKRQPELKIWASPWSPPYWMKIGGTIDHKNGGLIEYTEENMAAYGQYFRKFIEAYAQEGIEISMVSPQNEPTMNTGYSSCVWTGEQLRDFIRDYMGPALEGTGVEIYLGTFTNSDDSRVDPVLADPDARQYLSGITFQWWSYHKARSLYKTGFDLGMMQSETMCGDGRNNWTYAEYQFDEMWMYLESGITSYNLWNMVLEWDGVNPGGVNTTGGWFQNAPITVNEATKEYTLNPQYYECKHFMNDVEPGARRILSAGTYDADFPLSDDERDSAYSSELHEIAFRNPDGTNVLLVKNASNTTKSVDINFNGRKVSVDLPAHSIHTFTAKGTPLTGNETDMTEKLRQDQIVTIQNVASGQVLCIDGGSVESGAKIIQWPYGDQANQQWYLEPSHSNGMDTVKLVNIKSGSIAAVTGGSTNENATVILWHYEGNADQNWVLEETQTSGIYRFQNANSGLYLSVPSNANATQAIQKSKSNEETQLWKVTTVVKKPSSVQLKALDEAICQAEELLGNHTQEHPIYTQETLESLTKALDAAQLVAGTTNINEGRNDESAVKEATEALKAAISALTRIGPSAEELAALDTAISAAEKLESSSYTAETYAKVREALEAAAKADKNSRTEVLAATKRIQEAIAGLKEVFTTPGPSADQPALEDPSIKKPEENGNKQELPKKHAMYRVNKLYYTITKSSATAGTVSVKKPAKKTYTGITIPKTVKINGYSFKVTAIEKKAFSRNNKLRKITVGGNVTSIGKQAFANSKNLKRVVVKSVKLKKIKKNAFKGIAKGAVIDVPNKKSVLAKYKKMIRKSKISGTVKVK